LPKKGRKFVPPYEACIPKNAEQIAEYTFQMKEALWMSNLAQNMPQILAGKDVREIPKRKGAAIVIGAGQSVSRYKHLEILSPSNTSPLDEFNGTIICTDRMLIPCLKNRVVPNFVCTVDGDEFVAQYYNDPLVDKYTDKISGVFSTVVHPKVLERWKGEKYFFVSLLDDPLKSPKSLTRAIYLMTKKIMLHTMGNVGGFSWNLAYFLECDPIALIGLDYGYPEDTDLTKTTYHDAFVRLCKGDQNKLQRCYRRLENPHFGTTAISDIMWDIYRSVFVAYIRKAQCTTINCSPISTLSEEPIKQMDFEEFLRRYNA
jgi:hypothetical protein